MSRPYPRRPRKRKGHGPPHRYRGPKFDGFTPVGFDRIYDRLLPDVRGPARRTLFNELADRSSFLLALGFGAAGFGAGGLVGAVLAFGIGFAVLQGLLVRGRFIRR